MLTGAELIATERIRQVSELGWSSRHDDQHDKEELAWAAVCYAAPERVYATAPIVAHRTSPREYVFRDPWPASWSPAYDKRLQHARVRQLVIAGALIAAEIDRLLRAEAVQRGLGAEVAP